MPAVVTHMRGLQWLPVVSYKNGKAQAGHHQYMWHKGVAVVLERRAAEGHHRSMMEAGGERKQCVGTENGIWSHVHHAWQMHQESG